MPTTHRLILIPARHGRHVPILDDKGITDSREAILSGPTGAPVREAARELLHRGVARPDDMLEGRHSGTLSVSFRLPVGKAAGG